LSDAIRYARERRAFGKAIAEFGLIQHKLAEMAVRMYVNESMAYRLTGHIQDSGQPLTKNMMKAAEEFACECSFLKIFGSETLDYVVDEAVQIHGGYGYHQDYAVERAYRDARVNRIFEGTNEINRLLATGMLRSEERRGQLGLIPAVQAVAGGAGSRATESASTDKDEDARLVRSAKKIALFTIG